MYKIIKCVRIRFLIKLNFFPFIIFILILKQRIGDVGLIWRFSGEILKRDESVGAKIFTSLFENGSTTIGIDAVCEHLKPFPGGLRVFLEYLVDGKKSDEKSVHTRLAFVYIEAISSAEKGTTSPKQRMAINKLRCLLRTSKSLELDRLLETLNTPLFPHEYAIICGRLGQHSAALDIFIVKLQVNF